MSEFIRAEIRSKERQLQDISKQIAECVRREKEINSQLSACRESLSRKNIVTKPEQIQKKISDYERKLSEILREHERHEKRRDEIYRNLERLRENLAREERLQQREEQRKEKTKRDFSRAVTFSAGAVAAAAIANKQNPPQEEHQAKERTPRKIWKWLFFLVVIAVAANEMFSQDSKSFEPARGTISPNRVETELLQNGLSHWIGMTADDIFVQYGETFSLGYIAGSNYFYYEDTENCPYSFFYYEESLEPEADDIIWGAATSVEETFVTEDIQIGDTLQAVEATLGYPLDPQSEDGSDFYPFLEATANIEGVKYLFLFDPESKDLAYAMSGQY